MRSALPNARLGMLCMGALCWPQAAAITNVLYLNEYDPLAGAQLVETGGL